MLLLLSSKNLLTTFLCIEALSFCLYFILASSNTKGTLGNLLIYFILGAISSVIFALGIARIYLIVGSFDYIEIRYFFANVSELHSI
jgi:NADH-quinone oxidoreductase subunit N